ncbi:MAG: hypothetical protein M3162_00035 [Thermoproteota archaeon]|nr:hypothetical protein [Thermoproteota archaeon]
MSSSIFLGAISSFFIYVRLEQKKRNRAHLSNNAKSILDNILFEKSLALEAISRINGFFNEKKLDAYERDRLLMKYNNLLDYYDQQILKFSPILEAEDLYECRNQIVSAIVTSLDKLDKKLNSLSNSMNLKTITENKKNPSPSSPPSSFQLFTDGLMQKSPIRNDDNKEDVIVSQDYGNYTSYDSDKTIENLKLMGNTANPEQDSGEKINLDDYGKEQRVVNGLNFDDDFGKIQMDILNALKRLENSD